MLNRFKTIPWRKILRGVGWYALFLFALMVVSSVVIEPPIRGLAAVGEHVAAAAVLSFILALHAVFLCVMTWVVYDVPAGWRDTKQFFKDLPENWRKFKQGVAATFAFAISVPGRIARGIGGAWRWLCLQRAAWRAMPSEQRTEVLLVGAVTSLLAPLCYLFWPVAVWLRIFIGPWVPEHSALVMTFMFDVIISVFTLLLLTSIVGLVAGAIFRKK